MRDGTRTRVERRTRVEIHVLTPRQSGIWKSSGVAQNYGLWDDDCGMLQFRALRSMSAAGITY